MRAQPGFFRSWRRAEGLAYCGLKQVEIAQAVGLCEREVSKILQFPVVREHLEILALRGAEVYLEAGTLMRETLFSGLDRLSDLVDSGNLTVSQLLKVLNFICDREPSGAFSKATGRNTPSNRDIFDNQGIEALKREATIRRS